MRALSVLAFAAAVAVLKLADVVFLPAAVAFFVAVLLEPLVRLGERLRLSRRICSLLVVTLFCLCVAGAFWGGYRSFANLASQLPQYGEKLRGSLRRARRKAERLQEQTKSVVPQAQPAPNVPKVQVVSGQQPQLAQALRKALGSLAEDATIAAFVPFLALFLLMEKPRLRRSLGEVVSDRLDLASVDRQVSEMVRGYFLGNLALAAALAAIQWGIFAGLGLDNAFGLGVVTGFINVVPLIGMPLALVLPLAQALLQFNTPAPFVIIAVAVSLLHLANANYVEPRIIGAAVKLNAFCAVFAMLFWWWVWGAMGFLLGIPLAALLRIGLESQSRTKAWAALMSVD